jgi:RHS repeat-associated protein
MNPLNGGPSFQMTYDANGNMLTSNADTYTYDANNSLVTLTSGGVTTTNLYDGRGNLVKKSASDGTWTIYVGGVYERNSNESYVTYYNALGRRVATRTNGGTVRYLLTDHLGSSTQVLDAGGTLIESAKYYPYGSLRSGGLTLTDKEFTGQQHEGTAFGVYHYGARFYSTVLGRFLSADPLVVKPGDPQMLDRYAYVRNNPLKYVDPSGLSLVIVCGLGQNCEGTGANLETIDSFFWYAMAYWVGHEGLSAELALGRWTYLRAMVNGGSSAQNQLATTGVGFLSTAEDQSGFIARLGSNETAVLGRIVDDPTNGYVDKLADTIGGAPAYDPVDTLIGYSLGGYTVARFLAERDHGSVTAALLIEPAFESQLGYPLRDAAQVPGVTFVTLNGTRPIADNPVGSDINCNGYLIGAYNLVVPGCGEHCNHGESMSTVALAVDLLY